MLTLNPKFYDSFIIEGVIHCDYFFSQLLLISFVDQVFIHTIYLFRGFFVRLEVNGIYKDFKGYFCDLIILYPSVV
jgi:hypothetical protein